MIVLKIVRNGRWIQRIVRGGRVQWQCQGGKPKLQAPVIRLDSSGTSDGGLTPAILGKAILGRTILGKTSVLPMLTKPVIWLQEEGQIEKLSAPAIWLEAGNGEMPDDPPVVQKLAAPVIWLDAGEGSSTDLTPAILGKAILGRTILGKTDVAGLPKLSAPSIYLTEAGETVKLEAPVVWLQEESEVRKLEAPVIRLETVNQEEPEVPPVAQKLDAPVIRLEMIEDAEPEAPTITATLDGDIVSWNAVEGAKKYGVTLWNYSEGKAQMTTLTSFDLGTMGLTKAGVYDVTVYAYGADGAALCVSEAIQYVYRPKLAAPVISLEVTEDPVTPEQPVKLGTPEIWMFKGEQGEFPEYGGEGGGPVPVKLAAPEIYLEVIEDEEPEEPEEPDPPVIPKLSTPLIELYVEDEPEIPDEPERPDAPVIRVEGRDLVWDAVPGVTRYQWWFRAKAFGEEYSPWGNLPIQPYVTRLSLDAFNAHQYPGGTLETYLIAEVDGVESAPSNTVLYVMLPPKLNAPVIELETVEDAVPTLAAPVVSLNGSILSWNAVDGATVYAVMYDNNVLAAAVTETSVDLAEVFKGMPSGEFTVSVCAVATGENAAFSASSNAVIYVNVPKLSAPTIYFSDNKLKIPTIRLELESPTLYIDGEYLRWNAVPDAHHYSVWYWSSDIPDQGARGYSTDKTEMSLASLFDGKQPATYNVWVVVYHQPNVNGGVNYENSRSNTVEYTVQ